MTVADLIRELQRYPAHLPVRCVMEVVMMQPDENTEWQEVELTKEEALEVGIVEWRGTDVLLIGDGCVQE